MKNRELIPTAKTVQNPYQWMVFILYAAIFVLLLFCLYAEKINQDLSDNLIRLHIVANSNSTIDQDLKYRVRDALVTHMKERMDGLSNKKSATDYVTGHLEDLEAVANQVIASEGLSDIAKASFGKYPFPTKQYGNVILPAGFYESLKIEIGNADGENWWCVMFPPLCFTEDTKGKLDEEYEEILRTGLSEKEMDLVLAVGSENEIPVEIRFKIVELFQGSKIKLASLFRGIIKIN